MKKRIFFLFIVSLFCISSNAQWIDIDPINLAANATINAIHFTDSNVGHMASSVGVYKTTNGGTSWIGSGIPAANGSYSISFAGPNVGYVAGNTMYKTIDGGNSWIGLLPIQGAIFTPDENLQFTDANTGFVNASHGSVFNTTDGGSTWSQIKNAGGLGSVLGMYFVNNTTGYTVGYAIKKTINTGGAWTTQTSPTTSLLNAVHFVNANEGWAVGDGGAIIHTSDGGANWSLQNSGVTDQLKSVHFSDNQDGVAVGKSGVILKTKDGGTNWFAQTSNTTENLSDVFFYNNNIGYAVGEMRTVRKTTTGGDAPNMINSGYQKNIKMQLYPNPAVANINLVSEKRIKLVTVLNMTGHVVLQQQFDTQKVRINTEQFATGHYKIIVNYDNDYSSQDFSVRKR